MAEISPRCEEFELVDGRKIPLTLNFKKIYYLKANGHENEVKEGLKVINQKSKELDILDFPPLFWLAYLCAVDKPEIERDEFDFLLGFDISALLTTYTNLLSKKKK